MPQPVDVAVADDRFAVPGCPGLGATIEIDCAREHRVALHGVEQVGVTFEILSEAYRRRKKRMRGDDEPGLPRLQAGEIGERSHSVCAVAKIQQQYVATFNRAFDAGYQYEPAVGGVRREVPKIELTVVQRDGQRIVSEGDSTVDQLERCMSDAIDRIVRGMGVEFNL